MPRVRARALVALVGLLVGVGCGRKDLPTIRVGSKNYTEQFILAEIIAQHLENRLSGVRIVRDLGIGGTQAVHQALIAGDIDMYPEYSGAALTTILGLPPSSDRAAVREQVRQNYSFRFHLEWLPPLGFESGFAAVVRRADARKFGCTTLSEAAKRKDGWVLGTAHEFLASPDGYPLLMAAYNFPVKPPIQTPDQKLLYSALTEGQVEMVFGYATDGALNAKDLEVLKDDKHVFPRTRRPSWRVRTCWRASRNSARRCTS